MVTFDYGMREVNPINSMRFYAKNDPFKACQLSDTQVCYESQESNNKQIQYKDSNLRDQLLK